MKKKNELTKREQWLTTRLSKLLQNTAMTTTLLDTFVEMINDWKKYSREREMKKIDDEIARLTAIKKTL